MSTGFHTQLLYGCRRVLTKWFGRSGDERTTSAGTGFIVDFGGRPLLVTNRHVVDPSFRASDRRGWRHGPVVRTTLSATLPAGTRSGVLGLWRMLDATPTRNANGEPVMAGLRDHVLLLVGFVGALRRGELAGVDVEHLEPHEKGLTLHIPSSKTNQTGSEDELVILPASPTPGRCPVAAIRAWRTATGIDNGPLLRGLTKSQKPRSTRMDNSSINMLVKQAVARCGEDPIEYSAHGLRAGFVTYANLLGQPDRSIARQTRHKSLASLGQYVRISDAWTNNAAVELHI